ncbi:MAG: thiol protease/hemagglutinin PrtT [Bacteroidales bacterium]|jgi:hypothetical protein|nr:thiol protease/hemagglutinin PrtT [Bacteroidales bacterium]
MKKSVLLFVFLSIAIPLVLAGKVDETKAESVAARAIKELNPLFASSSNQIETVVRDGKPAYYIIRYQPEGWALISADDTAAPLLAYSSEGNYRSENQPESMRTWLASYEKQILHLQKQRGLAQHAEWETTPATLRSATAKISPFIVVNWNQSSPYNTYCPSNADGRALVGCVAVAMAQAMSVSKTPAQPHGVTSYSHPIYGALGINYDAEAPYKWNDIISGANNKNEVARLLYHCGIAVKMGYGKNASGAYTTDVPSALKQFFSYSSSVKYNNRTMSDVEWETLLQNELKAGRPVIYSGNDGTGQAGHAFNLDGYDGTSMYHVNWGWGGQNNGYYRIDNLHDQYANYTQGHGVVTGIKPISYAPSNITLSNTSIKEQVAAGTEVGRISVEAETTPANGYTYELKGAFNIFLDVYMPARFYVENEVLKSKEVFIYSDSEKSQAVYIKAINNDNGLFYEKMFTISVLKSTGIHDAKTSKNIRISARNQAVFIDADSPGHYSLYSLSGHLLAEAPLQVGLNSLPTLPAGCYIITILSDNTVYTKKILL